MKTHYGLIEGIIELTAWVMGKSKMPFITLVEDGDWRPWIPKYENQTTKLGHETYACTVYGAQTQIEILEKFLYGKEPNYAERFNYNLIPIDPKKGGVDPHVTYNNIQEVGLVDQKYLPMTNTLEEYMDKSDITGSLLAKGLYWLKQNDFQHEELWERGRRPQNYKQLIRKALLTCPVALSVDAWILGPNGQYISDGDGKNTHWFCALHMNDDGSIDGIDTYNFFEKTLHPDHDIHIAKRIWLNRRTKTASKSMIQLLQEVIKSLTMKKTLLQHAQDSLGIDITPDDMIPDTVACAITMSTLLRKVDPTFPLVAGSWTLWDILEHRADYARVVVPTPGTIIISPTGTGNGTIPGHVGIFMEDMTIASNDSNTGKFMKNYTLNTWMERYGKKGGFKSYLYKKV